jgi:hypothetical protein
MPSTSSSSRMVSLVIVNVFALIAPPSREAGIATHRHSIQTSGGPTGAPGYGSLWPATVKTPPIGTMTPSISSCVSRTLSSLIDTHILCETLSAAAPFIVPALTARVDAQCVMRTAFVVSEVSRRESSMNERNRESALSYLAPGASASKFSSHT